MLSKVSSTIMSRALDAAAIETKDRSLTKNRQTSAPIASRWRPLKGYSQPARPQEGVLRFAELRCTYQIRRRSLPARQGPPRWRLLEARRPGVDIIAGASLARRTVNLPLSIVKIRLWLPGRFVVARSAAVSKKCCPLPGDRGFESGFLQRRVRCEPNSRAVRARRLQTRWRQTQSVEPRRPGPCAGQPARRSRKSPLHARALAPSDQPRS